MARAYSVDLRAKAVAFIERGNSRREAARVFGTSPSFMIKLMDQRRRTGSLAPMPQPRRGRKLDPHRDWLLAAVDAEPDVTMPELARRLEAERGAAAAPAVLSRYLRACGLTRKKRRCSPRSGIVRT